MGFPEVSCKKIISIHCKRDFPASLFSFFEIIKTCHRLSQTKIFKKIIRRKGEHGEKEKEKIILKVFPPLPPIFPFLLNLLFFF